MEFVNLHFPVRAGDQHGSESPVGQEAQDRMPSRRYVALRGEGERKGRGH